MVAFVIRRLFGMAIVLIAVSFIVYIIFFKIPGGDPAQRIAGRTATHANIVAIHDRLGLDRPFYVQWYKMIEQLVSGNLISYTDQLSVSDQIWQGMPVTFSLSIGAAVIWLFFGIMVGVMSAVTAGRLSDRAITVFALIGISIPVFWLGIMLRYFLAEQRSLFPDGGYVPLTTNPAQWVYHLILPWFTLAVLSIGFYGRVLRSNILDSINEDFVRTARAKGQSPRGVLWGHVLRNAMVPVLTVMGLQFANLLTGTVVIEQVFSLPGLGRLVFQAIANRDLPVVRNIVMLLAAMVVVINFIVDVLYVVIDPRLRARGRTT